MEQSVDDLTPIEEHHDETTITDYSLATIGMKPVRSSTAVKSAKSVRKRRDTAYDRWTRMFGLCIALLITIGLWGVGALYTLAWLEDMGIELAKAGILAYLIPLAITGLEIGLWPTRTPHLVSRIFWVSVLLFDASTTAAGFVNITDGHAVFGYELIGTTVWVLGGMVGILLAIFPEKAARSLWSELRKSI